MLCFFSTDLHGKIDRYKKLFAKIKKEKPNVVFLGGDLFPSGLFSFTSKPETVSDFSEFLFNSFNDLKRKLEKDYPKVFLILGNDDGKSEEETLIEYEKEGVWEYIHGKSVNFHDYKIFGYSYVPPSPFQLKDWEKYDVSRFVDPGCTPPEDGWHTFPVKKDDIIYSTIQKDLEELTVRKDLSKSIFVFHSPPYQTLLDRAALDGKMVDYVPLDVHIGSIAIKRFIEEKQPLLCLHGHVHESTRLTGSWKDKIGETIAFQGAHDGKELSLIKFDPTNLKESSRELI
jgi:Icc-related predicted phosphoesterase